MASPQAGSFHNDSFVPVLRGALRDDVDGQTIVWPDRWDAPAVLDPLAAVMLDVIDGIATIAELAQEVHEEIGIDYELARSQVARIVATFASVGMLETSFGEVPAGDAIATRSPFVGPATHCAETASRARGVTNLRVCVGGVRMRVATNSRRAARLLRGALPEDATSGDSTLGYLLHVSPTGNHSLSDRTGIPISEGRGVHEAVAALAAHLASFLPPPPGHVRVLGRVVVGGGRVVVGVFPTFTVPPIDESTVIAAGCSLVDSQVIDIDVQTGHITHPAVPWPKLARLEAAPGHTRLNQPCPVTDVLLATSTGGVPASRAGAIVQLANSARAGDAASVLQACTRLTSSARVTGVGSSENLDELLRRL